MAEFKCTKCAGAGTLTGFGHIANGKCFGCYGAGVITGKAAVEAASNDAYWGHYTAVEKASDIADEWAAYGDTRILPSLFKALAAVGSKVEAAAILAKWNIDRAELVVAYRKAQAA